MLSSFLNITLLLSSLCRAWSLKAEPQPQKPLLNTAAAIFRPANEADLDDIVTVFIAAFSPSALWRYGYPHLNEHRHYFWRCMRKEFRAGFADLPNGTYVNMITVPVAEDETPLTNRERKQQAVAFAVWRSISPDDSSRPSSLTSTISLDIYSKCSDHLEANMTRVDDYSRQFSAAEKHYVEDFPHKQLYLGLLATHPVWDGHGFGARHVQWGLDLAEKEDVPVTLIASPAGWPLYDDLGFESLSNITIKTFEWEEDLDLWFEYMRRESK